MAKYFFFLIIFIQTHLSAVEFVLFTQPKTGTHLLIPILNGLTGKKVYWAKEFQEEVVSVEGDFLKVSSDPKFLFFSMWPTPWTSSVMDRVWETNRIKGTFLHLHPPYSPVMEEYLKQKNCISFFIKRDPRDQITSLLNHYKNIKCNDKQVEILESDDEKLMYMIKSDLRKETIAYRGWLKSPCCCILDFNKLMGAHGGSATDAEAMGQMQKIAAALQLKVSNKRLWKIYKKSFGTGWNFFRGKTNSWKEYFTEAHKQAVKLEIGDLLIELGYEKDLNW